MDQVLTPENFTKEVAPMWQDWEPCADLMRNVMLETALRNTYDGEQNKDLIKVVPYGTISL